MADQNRRMSEQFGDLEYEYDLLDHLDPIARAGFDPSRVRVGDPNDRMTTHKSHYQPVTDMITIDPRDLASKRIHAHEFRERGIDILLEELRRDSIKFIQKYGRDFYLKLSDLRDAIKSQNRRQMIEDGEYNKNFEEMISEFYEKHEDVNQGAEYYAGEIFNPKFGFVLGKHSRDTRIPTPAEKMALLKEHQRKTGTPIVKYVFPPDTAQEQRDRLETDNQVAFREYLKTNPADRVERVFFKTPYAEGERRRTRPLFKSVELLSQFAEEQNKEYGVRDPENFAQGGPVMRGIGTLNETARNMFRSSQPLNMPYGPEQQLAYQQPPFGMSGMQQGNGINQYGQYLEQTYGDPEFDQKRDTFLQEVQQKEQQTFGGLGGYGIASMSPMFAGFPSGLSGPQGIGAYQQFADGGPVYMSNGGEGSVERIKDGVLQTVFDVESNGDFNRWHDNAQNIPETPLTQMTVSEIMGYQGGENGPAAGAGQIKYNTFQYLLNTGTLKPDEVFSPQVQRKAHFRLLDRRGFNEWVQGELSNDGFIQRLAREYAAVPLAQDEQVGDTLRESGKSRYGGSNAHRISLDNMRNVLTSLKSPSMASEAALDEAMYAADYLEPQTMPLFAEPEEAGPDLIDAQSFDSGVGSMMPPTTGEELRQGFRPRFGSPAQEDDYMSMVPQKISMRDKYSTENIAADLVGGKEALEEGIGGLTESLRPNLRPSEIEFGEDKGGVFRSLMPPRRKQKEYPRNDPDALFRGLGKIRGRTLRKGFTPYVQDVRGELT